MQALETTIPWWRKALNFALDGIRSGFGLFSRSSKTETVTEPKFLDTLEETQEKETTLIDPSPKSENAAAPAILAEPVTATPAAEPVMDAAPVAEANPEPTEISETEIVSDPIPEPVEAAENAAEADPKIAETTQAETVSEALLEPVESAEPVAEADPEPTAISEAAPVSEPDPEPI
jgi:hypothetical protein